MRYAKQKFDWSAFLFGVALSIALFVGVVFYTTGGDPNSHFFRVDTLPADTVKIEVVEEQLIASEPQVIEKTVEVPSPPDTVYLTKDSSLAQVADSTREYVITGGDSAVTFRHRLRIAGKLLHENHYFRYEIPTRQITKTRTNTITQTVEKTRTRYKHNVFLGAATDLSVSLHYNYKWVFAGYEYDINQQSHTFRAGINLSPIFDKGYR